MERRNFWTSHTSPKHNRFMIAAAIFAVAPITMSPAYAGTISDVVANESNIIVRFDGIVNKAAVFALAGPDRIAVDISGATVGLAATAGGPVRGIRQGQFDADTARIVLDLERPAIITGGTFSADGRSLRLNLRYAALSELGGNSGRGRS